MPHIHLSTSADLVENVDIPDILRALVDELAAQESVDAASIKAYHSLYHTWAMGEGAQAGFASCSISILEGRPEELRVRIADAMFARLRSLFRASADAGEVNLTLELREMAKATYRR
jgi:5-carboxymethyl-2-hydroxymuconate isomerase